MTSRVLPLFPDLPVRGRAKPRILLRLFDAGDCYRAWRCPVCGLELQKHYESEPPRRWAEPCPTCNNPDAPRPTCEDCDAPVPTRRSKRCRRCAGRVRAEVFRARWLAAHPGPKPEPLFPSDRNDS